jgi:predicted nucleic acid-binding protein
MFDPGALIALERGHARIVRVYRMARITGLPVIVPTPVIAEWWREGRGDTARRTFLFALVPEAPDRHVAKLAGAAVGQTGASSIDALVVAAASILGDTVYTSDVRDLERLRAVFPGVMVEPV